MLIRAEQAGDHDRVSEIHRLAFGNDWLPRLVDDLRRSLDEQPGLSLVAVTDSDEVAAHLMFTRNLLDAPQRLVEVQVLSPVGVHPDHQRRGVGSALIRHGLDLVPRLGVPLVFLEGDPAYYSRFGFVAGGPLGFRRPSTRIPAPGFQVLPLPAYESWMTGTLVYRQEFWDHDAVGLRTAG